MQKLNLSRTILIILNSIFLTSRAWGIGVEMTSYTFWGEVPYVEVYLRVNGKSLQWENTKEGLKANVEMLLYVEDENKNILAYDKFAMICQSDIIDKDFIEIKRFALQAGRYTLNLEANDLGTIGKRLSIFQSLVINAPNEYLNLSDIIFLPSITKANEADKFFKNGISVEPLSKSIYDVEHNQLDAYIEVYKDSASSQNYYCKFSVLELSDDKIIEEKMVKVKKLNTSTKEALILSLPIQTLSSGEYQFKVEILDKDKKVIVTKSSEFYKINPLLDLEHNSINDKVFLNSFASKIPQKELDYVLKAHVPISSTSELNLLKAVNTDTSVLKKQYFIYNFWKKKHPNSPEIGYEKYMLVVDVVDKQFNTNSGYGFQSDRGHFFLKYGKPSNVISVDTEVDAPPYEIWYYYNLSQTNQNNVRFLFYNPSLSHNDYQLLHSTCLGEKSNPLWEIELYKKTFEVERRSPDRESPKVDQGFNRNARMYFNDF